MTETKKWFTDCYRRNLVDMHIEDWSDEFLSKFSPEAYVDNLKRAHIEAPMLYLQSHVGHCYWPTKTGHMHAAFQGREDMMCRLVALCRAEGMHPVGYYSLIYNTYEEDSHPEWRIVTGADGTSMHQRGGRYGHCCPNNPEYREFLKAQIDEMAEYFYADESARVDGMFYDMTFWPGLCSCPHCKALYKAVTGRDEYPAVNWASPEWRGLIDLRVKQMGEFARFITDYTKEKMPGVSVEHNFASAVASASVECGSTELVNAACDYTGGDLYGDLYNHSFTAKYYYGVTKNQPFEYMTCRCDHSLYAHTITKKEESLAVEVMLTAAHHGASFIIDAIDPVGTLDSRVYDRIGRVFERQIPYEPYFRGEMRQDVGVYYATTGRFNSRNLPFNSKTCSINAVRTLIEANIPVGVVANSTTDRLHRYKAVLAPAIAGISDQNRADLLEYVENGGLLYFSGVEESALLETLLGARFAGYTPEAAVYLAPTEAGRPFFGEFNTDYPMPSDYSLPIIEGGDYEVLATMKLPYTKAGERRFASIHSNPPGVLTDIPAVVTCTIGKGRVIWSAAPIENDNRRAHRELLLALLSGYMSAPSLLSNAPRQVELVTFEGEGELLVSAVDLLCTDELLPVRPFIVKLTAAKPSQVIRLGGRDRANEVVPFTYEEGRVCFTIDNLVMFDMYRVITADTVS